MTTPCLSTRLLLAAVAALTVAAPASADLTLTGRSSVASMGMPTIGQEQLLLKRHHLRRDIVDRGRAYSYLFDLKAREVTVLDHAFRTAEVHNLGKADQPTVKGQKSAVKLDLTKTGKQHEIRHWRCDEHSLQSDMPTLLGNDPVTFRIAGTVWLAAKTKEQREMVALRDAASNANYLLGLPSMAQVPPDQAKALGDTIRQLALKGILCGFDLETRYEGSGRMVELARKVATRMRIAYDDFSTDKIGDEQFAIPAGYRLLAK